MGATPIPARVTIVFAVAAVVLQGLAGGLYEGAASSSGLSVEPLKLLASGSSGAALIHRGSWIDMFGYRALTPVVVYLRARNSGERYMDVFAAAGLMVIVIGSIGAVSMATAAPPLMKEYATVGPTLGRDLLPAFATLYRAVVVGMWQTLETIPATIWLLGTASAARREGPRVLFAILLGAAALNGIIALYRLLSY